MRHLLLLLFAALVAVVAISLASCGGSENENPGGLDTPVDAPQCVDAASLSERVSRLEARVEALCQQHPGVCEAALARGG